MRPIVTATALGLLLALSCGDPKLRGPCKTTCDCKDTDQPASFLGEWNCNAQSICEYTQKSSFSNAAPSTCAGDDECNGSLCSSRIACK
jgi:hypothetical protein